MDPLVLTSAGVAFVSPVPDAVLNPAPEAGERAADRLPASTPIRPAAGPSGNTGSTPASGPNGTAGPSPFSGLTRTNMNSMDSQSVAYLSGNGSSSVSSVDDSPEIYLTSHDPMGWENNHDRVGIPREIVISTSQAGAVSACELISISSYTIFPDEDGEAPDAPPEGYKYGRVLPIAPSEGQVVPQGMFTVRIDPVDPARGGVPNVFYRALDLGGGAAPRAGNNAAANVAGGGRRRSPSVPADQRGPQAPRVTALRMPPYGLFERPPQRPAGFHYGRRLYLSAAEIQALAARGVRAPPDRMIIRLVHVDVAEGDSYERPTIFYQIEPSAARAPRAPSDDDPERNILYATLPVF